MLNSDSEALQKSAESIWNKGLTAASRSRSWYAAEPNDRLHMVNLVVGIIETYQRAGGGSLAYLSGASWPASGAPAAASQGAGPHVATPPAAQPTHARRSGQVHVWAEAIRVLSECIIEEEHKRNGGT